MPIRVPVQSVLVIRDGKRVRPPLGTPFEFTAKELAEINAVNPVAIRKPIQELATPATTDADSKGDAGKAKAKGDAGKAKGDAGDGEI